MKPPGQVQILRESLGLSDDGRLIHLDGNGIKVLFNHGVRRFLARTDPRESRQQLIQSSMP